MILVIRMIEYDSYVLKIGSKLGNECGKISRTFAGKVTKDTTKHEGHEENWTVIPVIPAAHTQTLLP